MPDNFILEAIDLVNQTTEDSQCDVLLALEDVYQKQLMLYESAIDPAYMDSMYMEADDKSATEDSQPLRSQSVIAKLIRMIKRLWQQMLTMISNISLNHSINKLTRLMNNAKDDTIPVPTSPSHYEFMINWTKNAIDIAKKNIDHDPKAIVSWLKDLEESISPKGQWSKNNRNPTRAMAYVPKNLIVDYIAIHKSYFEVLKERAKTIDKLLDENVTNGQSASKLSEDDIKVLNRASTILFQDLRDKMAMMQMTIDCISERFGDGKQPGIILEDKIDASYINIQIKNLLLGSNLSKQDKDHAFIVFDAVNSTDDDLKKIFLNKSTYERVLNPLPEYPNVIGIFLANKHSGSVKKWKIIKAKALDPSVKKMLGPEGVAVVKNTDTNTN